jgi:hypothetical protein
MAYACDNIRMPPKKTDSNGYRTLQKEETERSPKNKVYGRECYDQMT